MFANARRRAGELENKCFANTWVLVCRQRADERLEQANWFPRMRGRENETKRESQWVKRGRFECRRRLQALCGKTKAVSRKCSTQLPSWPQQHPPVSLTQAHTHTHKHSSCSLSPQQPSVPIQPRTHLPPSLSRLQQPPAACIWQNTFSTTLSATYFSTNNSLKF